MSDKFQNKYRIPSARLQSWDYRWDGAYFITICTKDRVHYFGEVKNGKMVLSNLGVLANVLWHEITHHAKHVKLGEFVVMPNHVHGILILDGVGTLDVGDVGGVETLHATSLHPPRPPRPTSQPAKNEKMANISPKSNSISTIIRSYKSAVTKHANRLGFDFEWQPRFYDHIIRDGRAFVNISQYIIHNPEKWDKDKFFD